MSKVPSFDSLKARAIGHAPVFFKTAQEMAPGGMALGQGMGGVTTGRPDEMQAPESADQAQFENDFSTLAYQFVVDRAPALLPYMLGFEVVDRSDDGSKAVGIYGYKIDDDFYYVPVFFINNQIRGVDMILSKRTNSFLPLTEGWIDYIVNRHAVTLGKTVGPDVGDTLEQPDLTFLRAPKNQPRSKMAEAKEDAGQEPMWSLKTAWHVIREQSKKMAEEDPLLKDMFNGVLRAVKGAPIRKCAEATYVNGFMRTVGGPESQISLLKTFRNVKFANAALTFYENLKAFDEDDVRDAHVHKLAMAKKAEAMPKLKVVTAADLKVEDNTSTDESEARQILSRGFSIRDARPAETTADMTDDVLTVDFEKRFSTPTEVGKYSFVMDDGRLREGFLLSLTHTNSTCSRNDTAVYFPEDKVVAMAPASAIIVDSGTQDKTKGGSYSELFGKAKDKSDVVPDNSSNAVGYLFIGPDGQAFQPAKVLSVFKDGDDVSYSIGYDTYKYFIRTKGDVNKPDFGSWDIHDRFHDANGYKKDCVSVDGDECFSPCCSLSLIRFGSGISKPSVTSNGIVLPDSWKVVEVANVDPWTEFDYNKTTEEERNRIRANDEKAKQEYREKYTFGSPTAILSCMQDQGLARVKIASVGPDTFHLHVDGFRQTKPLTYKEASLALVSHFGARPEDAFAYLDKTASDGSVRVVITSRKALGKEAQFGGVGVSMPMPTPQEASVDEYTGIPVYSDPYVDSQNGQFTGVPMLPPEGGLTRGIADGSEIQRNASGPEDAMLPIDQEAQMLAEQAAQAGQKHVFDQAAVGGLSKVYDTSAVVDSYIPNFMDSLDRLGRVLFLFYWKHDDFNQRYGSDDVVEMEDRLRGVFKQLGDLTLKLKEKAVRTER